jgi:hypothetical protein
LTTKWARVPTPEESRACSVLSNNRLTPDIGDRV